MTLRSARLDERGNNLRGQGQGPGAEGNGTRDDRTQRDRCTQQGLGPQHDRGIRQGERGAGTALVLGLVAALCMGLIVVLAIANAAAASGRAATASDLAALAAADAARGLGPGDPCGVARQTAIRNGAQVAECRRSGPGGVIVDIRTHIPLGNAWGWLEGLGLRAEGLSRAGPPPQPWSPTGR